MFLEELDSKHFYTPHILVKEQYIYLTHLSYCEYTTFAEVMRTAPTSAMEVLLGHPPLYVMTEAEARSRIYGLMCR